MHVSKVPDPFKKREFFLSATDFPNFRRRIAILRQLFDDSLTTTTTIHSTSTSWRSDGSPPCLGGSLHRVGSRLTPTVHPCDYGQEAVGGSQHCSHTPKLLLQFSLFQCLSLRCVVWCVHPFGVVVPSSERGTTAPKLWKTGQTPTAHFNMVAGARGSPKRKQDNNVFSLSFSSQRTRTLPRATR